jgi:hypothetical protein
MNEQDSISGVWREALAIIRRYPSVVVAPGAVLGALAEAPAYLITDRLLLDQLLTYLAAAFAYYLYLAYAEGLTTDYERGRDLIVSRGTFARLLEAPRGCAGDGLDHRIAYLGRVGRWLDRRRAGHTAGRPYDLVGLFECCETCRASRRLIKRTVAHELPRSPFSRTSENSTPPRTPTSSLGARSSAQCRHSGFPVGEDYRSRRGRC